MSYLVETRVIVFYFYPRTRFPRTSDSKNDEKQERGDEDVTQLRFEIERKRKNIRFPFT